MPEQANIPIREGLAIPEAELHFDFTRSGGPGGQHVNTSSTQVELTFDVAGSPSLNDEQKRRVFEALRGYISKAGVLRLTCQTTRSQAQNRAEAVERFQALLCEALRPRKRRRRTKPTRASKERRLAAKKQRSALKRLRQRRPDADS